MSLATRLQTSWELMKTSLFVLRDHPRLLLFPLVSGCCLIVLVAFFLTPLVFVALGSAAIQGAWHGGSWAGRGAQDLKEVFGWIYYSYGALIYLVSIFAATFFNVAFYNEIMKALGGDPVSLGGGLRFAWRKLPAIALWSLLAGTVGLLIRAIENRLGWLGKLVMGFVGVVWSVAAVFAIPVIIRREDSNPLAVLRDSAMTLKRTWGESLAGFVGIRLGGMVLVLLTMVTGACVALGYALFHSHWFLITGGAFWVLGFVVTSFLIAMATHVYRCALYVYASEGVLPGTFTTEMMNAGWKVKKS